MNDSDDDDNGSTTSSIEEINENNPVQNNAIPNIPILSNISLFGEMVSLLSNQIINNDLNISHETSINPEMLQFILNHNFSNIANENIFIDDDENPIFVGEEEAMANSFNDVNPIRNVIVEDVAKDILKVKRYDEIENREEYKKCPISLEHFKDTDEIVQLPCNHCFFEEPIRQWLMNDSNVCPICRFSFESVEINIHSKENDENDENDENEMETSDTEYIYENNDNEEEKNSYDNYNNYNNYTDYENIAEMILNEENNAFYDYDETMSVTSDSSDTSIQNMDNDVDSVD